MVVFIHELFYLTIMLVLASGFLMLHKDYSLFGLLPVSHPIKTTEVNDFFFKVHRVSCVLLGIILLGHVAAALVSIWPTMFAFQFLVTCRPLPGIKQLMRQSEKHVETDPRVGIIFTQKTAQGAAASS